jgi:hypothetical protein
VSINHHYLRVAYTHLQALRTRSRIIVKRAHGEGRWNSNLVTGGLSWDSRGVDTGGGAEGAERVQQIPDESRAFDIGHGTSGSSFITPKASFM